MEQKHLRPGNCQAVKMEAQGIEPWSESASETASTCVGFASRLTSGRRKACLPDADLRWCSCPVVEDY